jgi:hypothetical protein
MDSQRQNRAQAASMEPYKIVLKKITKSGDEWIIAPEDRPADMRIWTGQCAFVSGDLADLRKRVAAVRISFLADVLPAEGGGWVHAGVSDLMKILKAIRPATLGWR